MKNKLSGLLLAVLWIAWVPCGVFGQAWHVPVESGEEGENEVQDDPYRPNAYGNERVTPAYRYVRDAAGKVAATSIFTQQANVGPGGQNIVGDAANEPSIAVNPLDGNKIVIGWRQFDDVSSNFRQAGWSHSNDGGQSWEFVSTIETGLFRSDPVLDYDLGGKFYYNSLSIATGYECKVFGSTDGGTTWDAGTFAYGGDKQWMAIDRTGGVGSGNIYSFWSEFFTSCTPGFFTRSIDGNVNYESCQYVDGTPWRGTMAVGSNGEVYIGGMHSGLGDSVVFTKSSNAQTPGSAITWTSRLVFMDGALAYGLPMNPDGLMGQVNLEVDNGGGPGDGNVYMMGPMTRFSVADYGDVMFVRSTNGGTNWSAPIKVNDDNSPSNIQWMATMGVAPNGRIDAAWLDTRDSPGTDSSALYYAYSLDEGLTWSVNEKLSDVFDPHTGYPNQNKMGDYFDMVSTNAGAHLAWTGTLNGEEDVYYSFIVPAVLAGVQGDGEGVEFSIYPNPAGDFVVVECEDLNSRYVIYNVLGEEVASGEIVQRRTSVDVSGMQAGVYLVKVIGADGVAATKRLVKE